MKHTLKIIRSTFLILVISLIYIIIFETITRLTISLVSKNKNYLQYGFNKNFEFEVVDLSELKFNLNNLNQKNTKIFNNTKKDIDKKKIIWVFGASLTYGYACGSSSSSWPLELDKKNNNFKILNYGFPSIYSDDSIKILIHELNKDRSNNPDYILWAHRDEEILSSVRGIDRNKDRINIDGSSNLSIEKYYLLRIEKTFEKNFISYVIVKHIIKKMNKKHNLNVKNQLSEKDLIISSKNFELNTLDAIQIAKLHGVKKFYIVSLFSDDQFLENHNKEKKFRFFYDIILNKFKQIETVEIIDTYNLLPKDIKKEHKKFFCENKHYSLYGNQVVSEIINKKIFID